MYKNLSNKRKLRRFVRQHDRKLSSLLKGAFVLTLLWPLCPAKTTLSDISVVQHGNELFVVANVCHWATALPLVLIVPSGFIPILMYPLQCDRDDTLVYHLSNDKLKMYEYKSHDAALYCDGKNMYLGYHTPLMWDGSGFIAANEDSARHILASSNWKDNGFDAKKGWRLVRQQDLMTNNISQKKTIFRVDGEDYCFDYDDREINGNMSSRISLQGLKPGSEKHIVYNEYDGGLTTMFSSILTYWKIRYP